MSFRSCRGIAATTIVGVTALALGAACASHALSEGDDAADVDSGKVDIDAQGVIDDAATNADANDASPTARACSNDGFCPTALPPNSWLSSVWGDGSGIVWATSSTDQYVPYHKSAGTTGSVLRWDGTAWALQSSMPTRLYAIWGSGPTDLWVGGEGGLFHGTGATSDAITWTQVLDMQIKSIWGTGPNDVWAVGSTSYAPYGVTDGVPTAYRGHVFHYSGPHPDGGSGWVLDPISSEPMNFLGVFGTSAADVWLGGTASCIPGPCDTTYAFAKILRRSPDGSGGFVWSADGIPNLGGPNTAFSGGGAVGGTNIWLMGNVNSNDPPYNLFRGTDIYLVGVPNSTGGMSWIANTLDTCVRDLDDLCRGIWYGRAVWGAAPNDVYVGGDHGQLHHWDGEKLEIVQTTVTGDPVTKTIYGIWGSTADDVWVVGDELALHKGPSGRR